jgi:hypothetical protein
MPGFNQQLSTTEMWQMSVLLANADKLTDFGEGSSRNPNKSGT